MVSGVEMGRCEGGIHAPRKSRHLGARLPPMTRGRATTTDPGGAAEGTSAASSSVYANPRLYELAFGFRDFEGEVKFLAGLSEKHGTGALNDFLELGAGPAWWGMNE